ncbi:MAG TPA: PPK2 family polyphosphate kinase, partial [Gemmatimonadales bacterium]|nr:PPK2 family polyphosphate kinase [Gemmatimonadales bacterium]
MDFRDKLLVRPGTTVRLAHWNPDDTLHFSKDEDARDAVARNIARLDELQYRLYAERRRAVLIVLQGMDSSGKDGTIRHVMTGLNPQGCRVTAFKEPSPQEAAHDFLWRVHQVVPQRGDIAIFNRSHYEDVLAARVRKLVPRPVWSARYRTINRFEEYLAEENVLVVKFLLHISKAEQKRRLAERLANPMKQWKISADDFAARRAWSAYRRAYEDLLTQCSTRHAPWYIIPANKKWFRDLAVSRILVEVLEACHMR